MDITKATRWRRDGVISFEAEQRIVETEGGDYPDAEPLRWREALAYLGGLLVLGGGLVLALEVLTPSSFRGEGNGVGGLLISLVVAAGLAGAAWNLDTGDPISVRIVGFLAATAVVAIGGAAGILFFDVINPAEGSLLTFSVMTGAAAYGAWRWAPTALTQVVMHITAWLALIGVLIVIGVDQSSFGFFGLTQLSVLTGFLFLALGIGWIALSYTGYMEPKVTGYVLGILAASFGSQVLVTLGAGWVIVGLGLGAGLTAFGVRESRTVIVFFGSWIIAGAGSVALATLIDDTMSVAIAVAVVGMAALLLAVLMRDQGSWSPTAPVVESLADEPPSPSPF